jgi:hypothetical protein
MTVAIIVMLFWVDAHGLVDNIEYVERVDTAQECKETPHERVRKILLDYDEQVAKGNTPHVVCGVAVPDGSNS